MEGMQHNQTANCQFKYISYLKKTDSWCSLPPQPNSLDHRRPRLQLGVPVRSIPRTLTSLSADELPWARRSRTGRFGRLPSPLTESRNGTHPCGCFDRSGGDAPSQRVRSWNRNLGFQRPIRSFHAADTQRPGSLEGKEQSLAYR